MKLGLSVTLIPKAFFFNHPSRKPFAYDAVLSLEALGEEWPALVAMALERPHRTGTEKETDAM